MSTQEKSKTLITDIAYDAQQIVGNNHRGSWDEVASALVRCYGPEGDDLGSVPISIAKITGENEDGDEITVGWAVAETPDECTNFHSIHTTEDAARTAAEELAEELDATPGLDAIIEEIEETGYFEDSDIIPHVIKSATAHSQGYLLITPDISQPVGTRWTTNGYLQCDHFRLDATFGTEAEAAEALLSAIKSSQEESEEDAE